MDNNHLDDFYHIHLDEQAGSTCLLFQTAQNINEGQTSAQCVIPKANLHVNIRPIN